MCSTSRTIHDALPPRSKFNPLNTEQPARVVQGAHKELSKLQLHAAAAVNLKEAVSTQMVQ